MVDPVELLIKEIANFTVGFCILQSVEGEPDAAPMGTGTLVAVGELKGILTAAHVLDALPNSGEVGLVKFRNIESAVQKQTVNMALAEKVIISANEVGPLGPDIGFLRLPPDCASSLGATNSFLNLAKRRDALAEPGPPYFDAVVGVIGEWTENLEPRRPATRLKGFRALFATGKVVSKCSVDKFDLLDLELVHESGFVPPQSYGGVSGGGLWRIYLDMNENGPQAVREMRLLGLAFWQYYSPKGNRIIKCHGPKSIYGDLFDKIRQRWPEETSRIGH